MKIKSSIGGLVIARYLGDQVVINHGEITIEVVEIRGNRVKLAFKANKEEISILRVDNPHRKAAGVQDYATGAGATGAAGATGKSAKTAVIADCAAVRDD